MATERINYSGGEQTSASKKQTRIVGEAKKEKKVEYQGGEFVSPSNKVKGAVTEGKGIKKKRGTPKTSLQQMQKQNMMTGVSAQNGKLTLNDDVRSRLEKGFASVQNKRKAEAYKMKKPKGY